MSENEKIETSDNEEPKQPQIKTEWDGKTLFQYVELPNGDKVFRRAVYGSSTLAKMFNKVGL